MSDKQLTGTITLPGVDPELYELTGEFRKPRFGDWFITDVGTIDCCPRDGIIAYDRIILRRNPRKIRVTPTQADLDQATEPIPCWVRDFTGDEWQENYLHAIDKFDESFFDQYGEEFKFCEIEKEVTE